MKVLIVKLTSMGDLIQALPAISDAKQARPDIQFDWVVDEAFAEIPQWHPAIHSVIKTAHRRWRENFIAILRRGELSQFLRQLRACRYDVVIDAQTNLKSAVVTALCKGHKHGPDKASVREYPAHWVYKHQYAIAVDQLAIDRWRQLFSQVLEYPLPQTPPDFGLSSVDWSTGENLPATPALSSKPYLVAVTNASWENKYWTDKHWRELIAMAGQSGYQVLLTCGSDKEFKRSSMIVQGLENARVLPKTSLTEMAAIIKASAGAVCMDTGLAHLAAALDVPTVTLYGPTDPHLIGATGSRSRHVVATGFDCIPCYRRECVVPGYRGSEAQCLAGIDAKQVWQAFTQLLA